MMKNISALIFSVILFCLLFGLTSCGKNKPMGSLTTASDTLPETTQSTSQNTTSSETSTTSETSTFFETTETSDFFESSNGTLESTADPENTISPIL